MTELDLVTPSFLHQFFVNVSAAALCGSLIGAERQLRGKPAGLRVCILVVFTSAFFITVAREIAPDDAVRVLSSLVTGVGFLGGGVIFSQGGKISGITTATLIWALAAIGATIGFGFPLAALIATIVVIGALAMVDFLEYKFPKLKKEHEPTVAQTPHRSNSE